MSAPRHRFLSLLLVAFWFLATQHCLLEASELLPHHDATSATGCCSTQADGCEKDGCKAVEDGEYRTDFKVFKAAAPALWVLTFFVCADPFTPFSNGAGVVVRARWYEAPEWVSAWQFERRAAAPAHAPDALIA